jgi:hypothetical protein
MLLTLVVVVNGTVATAQSDAHPILDRMDYYVAAGKVYVSCVVSKGYTCFGIELKRSMDSVNYETVDIEYGICGSDTEPTYFSFEDSDPPMNQRLFYRLDLGGYGSTKVIETHVVDVQELGYRITPNPASDFTEVHFSNINKNAVVLTVVDGLGNAVLQRETTNSFIQLDVSSYQAGIYMVLIENVTERKVARAKLVIAR